MREKSGPFMILAILVVLLCGCSKQTHPVPGYPLEASAVESALKDAGLPWTIAEEKNWREDQASFILHDENGRFIATVSSIGNREERFLQISFNPPAHDQYGLSISFPEEECEGAIVFGTILFGGFESQNQVYKDFRDNYDAKKIVYELGEPPEGVTFPYKEKTEWNSGYNGIHYNIALGRPALDSPQSYLSYLSFSNSDKYPLPVSGTEGAVE